VVYVLKDWLSTITGRAAPRKRANEQGKEMDRPAPGSGDGQPAGQRDRLPPGQTLTARFPVLHAGSVPVIRVQDWRFRVWGLAESPFEMTFDEFRSLPRIEITADIHCVTGWSKFDTSWAGVTGAEIVARAKPAPDARHVMVHAPGWSTNLPLDDLARTDVLFAWEYDGKPLDGAHGWPLRLVVPHLYFWKSAKWVNGVEFIADDRPGFWEQAGYHMRGDPWREERYRGR